MQAIDIAGLTKEELVHLFKITNMHSAITDKDLAWARYEIANRRAKAVCDVATAELDRCRLPQNWERYQRAMKVFDKGMKLYAEADRLFKAWERH